MTPIQIETAIANLDTLLNSGAKSVTVDGITTVIDVEAVERRLKFLKSSLAQCNGTKQARPAWYVADLSKG